MKQKANLNQSNDKRVDKIESVRHRARYEVSCKGRSLMKRMKKAMLLPLRRLLYNLKCLRLYYWADLQLDVLRAVCVMPKCYYAWLYRTCLWLVAFRRFRRVANRAIHTIPYHIRFEVA